MLSRVWADMERIMDRALTGLGRARRRDLVSKLLAEDRTMWYATKNTERSTRGRALPSRRIAVTDLPEGSGAARRLLGLISLIPLAVDLGLEPFWTPVRLMA